MNRKFKFKLSKSRSGFVVNCPFYYSELYALTCILWKCKFYLPQDVGLIEPIYKHINELLDYINDYA